MKVISHFYINCYLSHFELKSEINNTFLKIDNTLLYNRGMKNNVEYSRRKQKKVFEFRISISTD